MCWTITTKRIHKRKKSARTWKNNSHILMKWVVSITKCTEFSLSLIFITHDVCLEGVSQLLRPLNSYPALFPSVGHFFEDQATNMNNIRHMVIWPDRKSGSNRLMSVCCFCQPWMLKCRESKNFLRFFLFFSLASFFFHFYFSHVSIFRSHIFSLDLPISAGHHLPFSHLSLLPPFLSPVSSAFI